MILTTDEKQDLDILFRLVDEAVVLRNQRVRTEQNMDSLKEELATINRNYEMAALRVEQQRTKMALALKSMRGVSSLSSRA